MITQSHTHGVIRGHHCFKCGTDLHNAGVRYLGHDWCLGCAQGEVKSRMPAPKAAASHSDVTDKPERAEMAAAIESLLKGAGAPNVHGSRWEPWHVGAAVGVILLVVGLGFVLSSPAAAFAGPTLTIAGTMLLAAVVHRR